MGGESSGVWAKSPPDEGRNSKKARGAGVPVEPGDGSRTYPTGFATYGSRLRGRAYSCRHTRYARLERGNGLQFLREHRHRTPRRGIPPQGGADPMRPTLSRSPWTHGPHEWRAAPGYPGTASRGSQIRSQHSGSAVTKRPAPFRAVPRVHRQPSRFGTGSARSQLLDVQTDLRTCRERTLTRRNGHQAHPRAHWGTCNPALACAESRPPRP